MPPPVSTSPYTPRSLVNGTSPSSAYSNSPTSSSSSCMSPKRQKYYIVAFVGWILGVFSVGCFYHGMEIRQTLTKNKNSIMQRESILEFTKSIGHGGFDNTTTTTSLALASQSPEDDLTRYDELLGFFSHCDFLGDHDTKKDYATQMFHRGLSMEMLQLVSYEYFTKNFDMPEIAAMKLQLRILHKLPPTASPSDLPMQQLPAPSPHPTNSPTLAPTPDPNGKPKHAIVIPYRQRELHLKVFKEFMNWYLPQHFPKDQFSIFVIEQDDQESFNRAWLANVGYAELVQQIPDVECITLHDVDMIPDVNNSKVLGPAWYDHCDKPVQTGSELEAFKGANGEWAVPYETYAGGIVTMHQNHWKQINGFSNDFVGWGGEDDDLNLRFQRNGLQQPKPNGPSSILHPPKGHGRFKLINQSKEHHTVDKDKQRSASYQITLKILAQMRSGSKRHLYDGLTDLQYDVTHRQEETLSSGIPVYHIKARQYLLEFVHIPKSAGSAIETAAGKAGVPWGACHWANADAENLHCPQPPNWQNLDITCRAVGCDQNIWLVPSYSWNIDLHVGKKSFAVVRDPYERVVSLFYDKWHGYQDKPTNDTRILNEFVQDKLQRATDVKWKATQSSYVFSPARARVVKHVLKYENLQQEFPQLMEQYGLKDRIQLEDKSEQQGFRFQVSDFTDPTLRMIEQKYRLDFDNFGYQKRVGTGGGVGSVRTRRTLRPASPAARRGNLNKYGTRNG